MTCEPMAPLDPLVYSIDGLWQYQVEHKGKEHKERGVRVVQNRGFEIVYVPEEDVCPPFS